VVWWNYSSCEQKAPDMPCVNEVSAMIFGVFLVKNHDFTPKNHIFSNFRKKTSIELMARKCVFCNIKREGFQGNLM
jgi:hypothetical protein